MKMNCRCGHVILDATDHLPHKGHVIADTEWLPLLEAIDELVAQTGPSPREKEATIMQIRSRIGSASRSIWQCAQRGDLYLDHPGDTATHFKAVNDLAPGAL